MSPRASAVALAGLALSLGLPGAGAQSRMAYFGRARLDIPTLTLHLEEPLVVSGPVARRHFVRNTDFGGRHEVADCEPVGPKPPTTCYNIFQLDPSFRLVYRTKYQRLLAADFGTLYGIVTRYYGDQYRSQPDGLETRLYLADLRQEAPREDAPPDPAPDARRVVAVSVARVVPSPPVTLVVSANYARDGHLYMLHVYASQNGSWIHTNELRRLHADGLVVGTAIGDRPRTRARFGLPEKFPVDAYLRGERGVFESGAADSRLDAIFVHYDGGRIVRREVREGARIATHWLHFEQTPEDAALAVVDAGRPFADVPYTRDPSFRPSGP